MSYSPHTCTYQLSCRSVEEVKKKKKKTKKKKKKKKNEKDEIAGFYAFQT